MLRNCWKFGLGATVLALGAPALAQVPLDRADPTITEQQLPTSPPVRPATPPSLKVEGPATPARSAATITGIVNAVSIEGREHIPAAFFAGAVNEVIGRELSRDELAELAGTIGQLARAQGYPFAMASIAPQPLAGGILRISLDLGRISAVRVIGAPSPQADRLLAARLVTDRGVRLRDLEAALLLISDIPGIRVKDTRYVRQDGFGILLVTIVADRAQAYAQVDNRGSREIGPIRSTMLGSIRGIASSGDELATIVSQTPLYPSQFIFIRGRYSAPVDSSGAVLSASISYGHSNPGGSLKSLDVTGDSLDVAATYARPLIRSRRRSLWAQVEFRGLTSDQHLAGVLLRRDRISTLSVSLNGAQQMAGGTLRAEIAGTAGLPLAGATRWGNFLASRFDGDARFATASFLLDWTAALKGPLSLVLASGGQVASRPLLATAEIGLGGPAFGRAYDYAERTGDNGIMGAAELRIDIGKLSRGLLSRFQSYAFVDGGSVGNLRHGIGGGTLASTGAGVRLGRGKLDGMIEVAVPLNADRFDTRDRSSRISARLSIAL